MKTTITQEEKYLVLTEDMRKKRPIKSVVIVPAVISAFGGIPQQTIKSLNTLLKIDYYVMEDLREAALLSIKGEHVVNNIGHKKTYKLPIVKTTALYISYLN